MEPKSHANNAQHKEYQVQYCAACMQPGQHQNSLPQSFVSLANPPTASTAFAEDSARNPLQPNFDLQLGRANALASGDNHMTFERLPSTSEAMQTHHERQVAHGHPQALSSSSDVSALQEVNPLASTLELKKPGMTAGELNMLKFNKNCLAQLQRCRKRRPAGQHFCEPSQQAACVLDNEQLTELVSSADEITGNQSQLNQPSTNRALKTEELPLLNPQTISDWYSTENKQFQASSAAKNNSSESAEIEESEKFKDQPDQTRKQPFNQATCRHEEIALITSKLLMPMQVFIAFYSATRTISANQSQAQPEVPDLALLRAHYETAELIRHFVRSVLLYSAKYNYGFNVWLYCINWARDTAGLAPSLILHRLHGAIVVTRVIVQFENTNDWFNKIYRIPSKTNTNQTIRSSMPPQDPQDEIALTPMDASDMLQFRYRTYNEWRVQGKPSLADWKRWNVTCWTQVENLRSIEAAGKKNVQRFFEHGNLLIRSETFENYLSALTHNLLDVAVNMFSWPQAPAIIGLTNLELRADYLLWRLHASSTEQREPPALVYPRNEHLGVYENFVAEPLPRLRQQPRLLSDAGNKKQNAEQ